MYLPVLSTIKTIPVHQHRHSIFNPDLFIVPASFMLDVCVKDFIVCLLQTNSSQLMNKPLDVTFSML